jgi:hypothetical protein
VEVGQVRGIDVAYDGEGNAPAIRDEERCPMADAPSPIDVGETFRVLAR